MYLNNDIPVFLLLSLYTLDGAYIVGDLRRARQIVSSLLPVYCSVCMCVWGGGGGGGEEGGGTLHLVNACNQHLLGLTSKLPSANRAWYTHQVGCNCSCVYG